MSRKIIFIGECTLDIEFDNMKPVRAGAFGLMPEAARRLASAGYKVSFTGEVACDRAGDFILDSLAAAGVDVNLVDRCADGATPLRLIHTDRPDEKPQIYIRPSRERLSFGWPDAERGDIVVFGGWFALNPRTRSEVMDFVKMCAGRNMITVFLPGYEPQLQPAVTHVMPDLLDSLESAMISVTTTRDLQHLWQTGDPERSYTRNIGFYTPLTVNIDQSTGTVTTISPGAVTKSTHSPSGSLPSAVLAGFLAALADDTRADITSLTSNPPACQPM